MALKPIVDPETDKEFYVVPRDVIGAESVNALGAWKRNFDAEFHLEHGHKDDEETAGRGGGFHTAPRFCKLALWIARPTGNDPFLRASIIDRRVGASGPISYQVVGIVNNVMTARIIFNGPPPGREVVLDSYFSRTSSGVVRREARIIGNYIELKVPAEQREQPIGVLLYG